MEYPRSKVLIVDDAPENLRLLKAILRSTCDLSTATCGREALELAASEPQPDLILLDVIMPGMSGDRVCEALKQNERTRNIPVIFVTGLSDVGEEEKGLKLGAVDYIVKPFHPELVRARVSNHLELKRHRDHLESEVERRTQALLEAKALRQRIDSELEVASRLQRSMLPPAKFHPTQGLGFNLASALRAARTVGGDLYDYFLLDESNLLFVQGDVSDKGIPAALFMVKVCTLIRTLGPAVRCPASLLRAINQALCEDNPACMFVTLICGILQLHTGELWLAHGGHESPVRVGPHGMHELLELEGGPALGLCPDADYQNHELSLEPGHSLVLYTDGMTEASDQNRQFYGIERLLQETLSLSDLAPAEMVSSLMNSLSQFETGCEPFDDVTLMVVQRPHRRQLS